MFELAVRNLTTTLNRHPDSSDLDLPFTHLKTPNLDFPLTGGDIAEELSWQDVLIEIAGDQMMIRCVTR